MEQWAAVGLGVQGQQSAKGANRAKSDSSEKGDKGEKLAQRLSQILSRLHQGEQLDKHALAQEFQVDVRTIERDLCVRLAGLVARNAQGLWAITQAARSTVPATHLQKYGRLAGTDKLFPNDSLHYLLDHLDQLDQPEPQRTTLVRPVPAEDLRPHSQDFAQLEAAIQQHQQCQFVYRRKARTVRPYQLIYQNGIWYLAAEEGTQLKIFSVALIEALAVDAATTFVPKAAHQAYIAAAGDVWFTAERTEVLLRVAPEVAHYFTRRTLLPHQHCRDGGNGSLLVSARINHIQQLLPVVRYWLPHVRIVQPQAWHAALVDSLRTALRQWNEDASPEQAANSTASVR